jgi:hypothetical protein
MERLVYYSLAASRANPRPDLVWQIESSIRSLRTYNRTVPVIVFTYGDVPEDLAPALGPLDVIIHYQGSYEARLAGLAPRAWPVLSQYPILHKFLNFREIDAYNPEQVLYLDCDTLFFNNVDMLFGRYAHADCYAREEPTCGRSHYGYDPSYLDESALAKLGEQEGIRPAPPFNLGIVLFNNGIWRNIAGLEHVLLSYAWRFAVWMAMHPLEGDHFAEGLGVEYLRGNFEQLAAAEDVRWALPYPSVNRWILEQVSFWLTLGHVPNLSYQDFFRRDVLQNGEILARNRRECDWVVCHYFSNNKDRIDAWMNDTYQEKEPEPQPELASQ